MLIYSKHQHTINTWCEQYIECITSNPHLKNEWLHIKNWHVLYISHHFSTLNSWYMHFSIYYKYLLNFQWKLFYKIGSKVTISRFFISSDKFPCHMIFFYYSKGVLEHIFCSFTKFSHVIVTWIYVSERFSMFLTCMLIVTNLNMRCI